ncbi:GNAT family N-acetyltransferase [Brevibacterium sp. RIT 803]|uniref:GNAT family N-acetyltransferase n=1 Tax=Brevibacterium sp. RIT 803 TaxID=2810210 RepID=UPI001951E5B1|nr:GNAT family N-acetyltransferase [Brevibacterium sp. RIT 803]
MTTNIRTAAAVDITESARTLAIAFDNYPWTRWSIPEDDYAIRLKRLQAIYLTHAVEQGLVLVSDDLAGVAALLPPESSEPAEALQAEIADLMGERGELVFSTQLPQHPEKSWNFATIGVRPESAGQGLGSSIIEKALKRASLSSFSRVSLETSEARNVRFYERHGFVVTHRTEIENGPTVWTMVIEL